MTLEQGKGYYEDRRPASNINSYLVTLMIADTTLLNSKFNTEILSLYKKFKWIWLILFIFFLNNLKFLFYLRYMKSNREQKYIL